MFHRLTVIAAVAIAGISLRANKKLGTPGVTVIAAVAIAGISGSLLLGDEPHGGQVWGPSCSGWRWPHPW